MVGVPRSKGCRICVQRRVKCDQTRPTCNNCKKGNRPCPGYNHDLKFQDEGARLRRRFEPQDAPLTPADSSRESTNSPPDSNNSGTSSTQSPTKDENTDGAVKQNGADGSNWDVVGLDVSQSQRRAFLGLLEGKSAAYDLSTEEKGDAELFSILANLDNPYSSESHDRFLFKGFAGYGPLPRLNHIVSPDTSQRQLVTAFTASLYPDNGTLPKYLQNHARWLSHLPPLTGTNPLLDASVRAVTLVHIGRLNNSEQFVMESRPYYGQALRLLNKTLQDRTQGVQNETLCAVILLSFYEMFASDNNEAWVRHAGGVSALMRARGPERHRYGLDREIFLAYRYMLIIETFQQDVPCFLAEAGWINLSNTIHQDLKDSGVTPERREIFDLAEEYYQSMVVLPALTAKARAMWDARQNGMPPPVSRAHLIEEMTIARLNFKSTFGRFEAALKRARHAPTIKLNNTDPLIGIEYEFVNTFVSATYVGYWTVSIVLNMCLQGLQSDDKDIVEMYRVESKDCALNICRSTACMLTSSFLGPFFLIFGLRVSLLVLEDTDGPEPDWILRKLFQIGDRHMSIAKHVPGYRPGITANQLVAEFKLKKAEAKAKDNPGENLEFIRQVAHGEIYDENGLNIKHTANFEDMGPAWEGFNQTDEVLQTWDDQVNFPILEMDNLHVANSSTTSRQPSPMPPLSSNNVTSSDQFTNDPNAFAMPDMELWDQGWNNIAMMDPTAQQQQQQQQQQQDFMTGGQNLQPPRFQPRVVATADEGISRYLLKSKHWNGGRMNELKTEQGK